ncbi:MAG: tetraacyldisaccharide 4'-kinase [Tannerellaceae bacterium]|jgi:tetraacyldisaccharide 4'-kinase|nr:tetraacyldisaccharide 4'-kinase [Tannerellaceae bacterium]
MTLNLYNTMEGDSFKLNYWLTPIALLYGMGVRLRNQLFNWGILPSEEFAVPLISVGNLATGGTGKTPHVEYLIRLLKDRYKVAVLSRGYKRKTKGYVLAGDESNCQAIGDEPFQIKRKFPGILVAVDSDRRRGVRNLTGLPEGERPDVILLDDAFQHRYVTPSLSVVLTDYNRFLYRDKLLPVGRLREPAAGIRRADVVVVSRCAEGLKPIDYRIIADEMGLLAHQELYFTHVTYGEPEPLFPAGTAAPGKRRIQEADEVLLLAGIAAPEHFIEEVKRHTDRVTPMVYPDHHRYTRQDIRKINEAFGRMQSADKYILTTEKDAARLLKNPAVPEEWKGALYYLPIAVEFRAENGLPFDKLALNHIVTVQRNSVLR